MSQPMISSLVCRYLALAALLFSCVISFAQPSNDDCSGLIQLGNAPNCDNTVIYTNVGATPSNIGAENIPSCFSGEAQRDVWFSFVAVAEIEEYELIVTGIDDPNGDNSIVNPEIAVYRGLACAQNQMGEYDCATFSEQESPTEATLELTDLTPGIEYFVRITDWSNDQPNAGSFNFCIQEKQLPFTVDQEGSNKCSGELYDSGGPDANYDNNDNYTFTICPTQEHECIAFDLVYFSLEENIDLLSFYDGPNTSSDLIIGYNRGDGGASSGGVCNTIYARSGCLTVEFISDDSGTLDGFYGRWECSTSPCEYPTPISINAMVEEEQIIENLTDASLEITIDTIKCKSGQYAVFDGVGSSLGLENGILLTTGMAANAIGPNDGISPDSESLQGEGDADLEQLSTAGVDLYDACVLELDVFVPTNEISFEYVFGSEEYPEFVGDVYNDIFAFFISGPGIEGDPNLNNQENIAILPNSDEVVSINSVNNISNWQYYRNNNHDFEQILGPLYPLGRDLEYDGFTSDYLGGKKSLTASKQVTPCNTYRLKLAIADLGDDLFDSGVFISKIKVGSPTLSVNFKSGLDYLIEECVTVSDELIISIPNALDQAVTYQVAVSGTAILQEDYILDIPAQVTFEPGETTKTYPITIIDDDINEDTETIIVELQNDFGCGLVSFSTVDLELKDDVDVNIDIEGDTILVCDEIELTATGGEEYTWYPTELFDNPNDPTQTINVDNELVVYVEGRVGECVDTDSILIQAIDSQLSIVQGDSITLCPNEILQLQVETNNTDASITWTSQNGITLGTGSSLELNNIEMTTLITATLNIENCEISDVIRVNVPTFGILTLPDEYSVCPGDSAVIFLDPFVFPNGVDLTWSPQTGVLYQNDEVILTPNQSTEYIITQTELGCQQSFTTNVIIEEVQSFDWTTDPENYCLGDQITIYSNTTPIDSLFGFYELQMGDLVEFSETPSFTYSVEQSDTLTLVSYTKNCPSESTLEINVSEEAITISNLEDTEGCLGETITLSPSVNIVNASYTWTNQNGDVLGTESNLAVVVTEQDQTITLTVSDANNCNENSEQVTVIQSQNCGTIEMPNVFSPNGDNVNDVFRPATNTPQALIIKTFKVYNRWGQLVYDYDDTDNKQGWDGKFDGKALPSDTYIYTIEYDFNQVSEERSGEITLIR